MSKISLDQALDILDNLASRYDIIYIQSECPTCGTHFESKEIEASYLEEEPDFDIEDTINYYNMDGNLVEGTLLDMIVDRLGYEVF